jgi:hypothetical protein
VTSLCHGLVQIVIFEQLQNSIENTHKCDLTLSWLGTNSDIFYKTSLIPPHVIEVLVPSHENERSHLCVFSIEFCNCSDITICTKP